VLQNGESLLQLARNMNIQLHILVEQFFQNFVAHPTMSPKILATGLRLNQEKHSKVEYFNTK